jgi:cell division protein FtsI/penicillin-binding protein 2
VIAALMLFLVALAGRLIHVQFLNHEDLEAKAINQHGRLETLESRPGDVLDVRGRPLATSVETASVFVDPKSIGEEKRNEVAESLALVLDLDAEQLHERLAKNSKRRFLWVKRRVTDDEVRAVRDLKWPGNWVGFQTELRRCYPQGPLASQVVGIRDIDGKSRDGIEKKFDELLRGKSGTRLSARDGRGKMLAVQERFTCPPEPGSSIVLTIDSVIQTFAEEALDRVMADWKPTGATAIVMRPHTGEILAMASRPTFDPEDPSAASSDAWVNRAISDTYEPGSTFKPFIVSAALDWGIVKPDDQINCHNGVYKLGPRLLHSHHPNGVLTVPEVVVKSDNIGMAIIGERMTNAGLYRAVQEFGFGRPTGIELPGESSGAVRPLRQWTPFYSTGSVPMGQELSVTPLQLITAFSALANGGELLRPRIVRAIVGPDGKTVQVFDKPEVVSRPIRAETASYVVESILTEVVERGTGKKAQIAGYSVFGKTGTAQKQSPTGGYLHHRYISSFIAGAPASNPELVTLVLLNDPSKGPEPFGGKVAAPAVAEILARSLVYLSVPHDRESVAKSKDREPFRFTD